MSITVAKAECARNEFFKQVGLEEQARGFYAKGIVEEWVGKAHERIQDYKTATRERPAPRMGAVLDGYTRAGNRSEYHFHLYDR